VSKQGPTEDIALMPHKKITFATIRKIGLALPGAEEGTAWGTPALKVGGKMFACVPSHRSAEPDSLAVRIDFKDRDELVAAEPGIYYLEDHYVPYPCVLIRLSRIREDALRDLLLMAWRFVSAGGGRAFRQPQASQSRNRPPARRQRIP